MKKLISIFLLVCIALSAQTAFAEDTVFVSIDPSQANTIAETGFLQGALPAGCTAELTDGAIALKNGSGASSTAANLLYSQNWSSSQTNGFVAQTRMRFDSLSGNPRIDFRFTDGSYDYALDIRNGAAYVNRTLTDFAIEQGVWYDVQIFIHNADGDNISVFFDGVKIGGYTSTNISKFTGAGVQLRIEAVGRDAEISVGKTSVYKPGDISMQLLQEELETPESPVSVGFTSPVAGFAAEDVKAWRDDGMQIETAAVTPQFNSVGNATGFVVEFAEPLAKKRSYYITIGECKGIFGQSVETRTGNFSVVPDDYDYAVTEVKLYSGIGGAKKEISGIKSGFITFEVTAQNNGVKDGQGTVLVEVYDKNGVMIYSGGVKKHFNAGIDTVAYLGVYLPDGASEYKVRLVDSYSNKQDLGGGGIED